MRLREGPHRIAQILLLAFVLTATWPCGNYGPRFDLSYQTKIPAALNQTTRSYGAANWLLFLSTARAFVVRAAAPKYQQQSRPQMMHVAALSFARDSLEPDDSDPLPRAEYEQLRSISFAVLRPAERGPPALVSSAHQVTAS